MEITVLVDNNTFTDEHFLGEPGLCYWIKVDGKRILFDLGFSDVYIKNAEKLKINLRRTDFIILSHGHNDHTQGLKFSPNLSHKVTLISHPDCLLPKYIAATKEVFNNETIFSVIGGFHLRGEAKKRLEETVKVLSRKVSGKIYPAHCSDFKAKCFLAQHLNTKEVFVSQKLHFA